jgi:hypothetical protein
LLDLTSGGKSAGVSEVLIDAQTGITILDRKNNGLFGTFSLFAMW